MYHDLYIQSGAESGFQNESAFQYKIQVDEFEKQVKAVVDYCREACGLIRSNAKNLTWS